jgi:hypothetical protein
VSTGSDADDLRQRFALEGAENVAKAREGYYRNIFPGLTRVDGLEWKDDRDRNVVAIAETFRVDDAAGILGKYSFGYRSHLAQNILGLPPSKDRNWPLMLPRPGAYKHRLEFRSPSMGRGDSPAIERSTNGLSYDCRINKRPGNWIWKYTIKIKEREVAAENFSRHRMCVEEIWPSTGIGINIPIGSASTIRHPPLPKDLLAEVGLEDYSAAIGDSSQPNMPRGVSRRRRRPGSSPHNPPPLPSQLDATGAHHRRRRHGSRPWIDRIMSRARDFAAVLIIVGVVVLFLVMRLLVLWMS